jgi:hypothetical protein
VGTGESSNLNLNSQAIGQPERSSVQRLPSPDKGFQPYKPAGGVLQAAYGGEQFQRKNVSRRFQYNK